MNSRFVSWPVGAVARWALAGGGGVILAVAVCEGAASATEPVAIRIANFPVAPAHMPAAVVCVRNLLPAPYRGTIRLGLPDGWECSPAEREISLAGGETGRVAFTIRKARPRADNTYPLEAIATGGGTTVTHRQDVVCASAPYFKPRIDGKLDDWEDAIPATFSTSGKKTTISTFWNRRQFSILVAVEEDRLAGIDRKDGDGRFDAVQLAISPRGTVTGTSPEVQATRYEFLLAVTGKGGATCFLLTRPGKRLGDTQAIGDLTPLAWDKARVAVKRAGGVTYYECGIPFRGGLTGIRPGEGREFFLSVLVHDPHGTGLRDWGRAAGLWPQTRNRLAWSRWPGGCWQGEPPLDNKAEWGMCSSKY